MQLTIANSLKSADYSYIGHGFSKYINGIKYFVSYCYDDLYAENVIRIRADMNQKTLPMTLTEKEFNDIGITEIEKRAQCILDK